MDSILEALDREWDDLAASPRGRRTLARWAHSQPALAGFTDLSEVLASRRDPTRADRTQRALAALAAGGDDAAALTLLKALLPGLVTLAGRVGSDDDDALGEVVAFAWERIRTYPCHRNGTVASNVVLDVRKWYRAHRSTHVAGALPIDGEVLIDDSASVEDEVMGRLVIDDLAAAQLRGLVSRPALAMILRTRIGGESLADVAEEHRTTVRSSRHRRWRAETKLRALRSAA